MQSVFSNNELGSYFADQPDLLSSSAKLDSLIQNAVMIAESGMGANQPLDSRSQTEQRALNSSGRVRLASSFVTPNTIAVSIRYPLPMLRLENALFSAQWTSLTSGKWVFDADLSELTVLPEAPFYLYSSPRPTQKRIQNQVKISYTCGVDWTANNSTISKFKAAIAGITKLLNSSSAVLSGVKSYELTDFYVVQYSEESSKAALNQYLQVFQNFRTV
jgi:hypothetical protein